MDIEQAHRIHSAIADAYFAANGIKDDTFPDLAVLKDVPLSDMLEAARLIRKENSEAEVAAKRAGKGLSFTSVADDRLIAAVYVLVNYEHSREPIVNGNRRLVAVLPASTIESKPKLPRQQPAAG